jgi:nucleoside-diphosphate-sugar epimerase
MSRILVTGASGFLGACLVRRLAADGHEVVALGRSISLHDIFRDAPVTARTCDLLDAASLSALDVAKNIDSIVHCAGLSSSWGSRRAFELNNITATANLLDQSRRWGASHFVYISSSSVYFRFCDQLETSENVVLPTPVNDYAWSKVVAEKLVRSASDIPATIVRPRGIYGKGDTALLPRLLRAAKSGPVPSFRKGRAVIDLTHVEDVVSAIVCILQQGGKAAGSIYNVSGGEAVSIRDIINRSAKLAGIDVTWREIPWPLAFVGISAIERFHKVFRPAVEPVVTAYSAGLLAFSQTLDLSAIRNEIGWRPAISFDEGLRRTFSSSGAA